jgi:hypothetical protein
MKKELRNSLFIMFLLSGCATSIPLRDSKPLHESKNPVMLIQYTYEAKEPGTQNLYFRDSNGKDFRVSVPKDVNPAEGILFELPSAGGLRLFRFSHPDANQPADVENVFPMFFPQAGKINHVGFFSFKYERDVLYVNPVRLEDSVAMLTKAIAKHGLKSEDIVNGYTGKPLPAKNDNGVVHYKTKSGAAARIKFEEKVWKCQNEENRRNLIILGTLRYVVNVTDGKISSVKVTNSSHSASKDFEDCAEKMLMESEATPATFSADIPVIF